MTRVTTHVLDTASGVPAAGVAVALLVSGADGAWSLVGREVTDSDGRIVGFSEVGPGRCRLVFDTGTPFFPEVAVTFAIEPGREQVHVPLLLSPFGYSVYRGS